MEQSEVKMQKYFSKYRVAQKSKLLVLLFINLANVDRFSKSFCHWIQYEIRNKIAVMFPITHYLCIYITL